MNHRFRRIWGLMVSLLLLVVAAVPVQGAVTYTDGPTPQASSGDYAFVRFADAPLASYDGSVAGYDATKPGGSQKLDLNSPAAKKYGNRLQAQRENYKKWLAKQYPNVQILAEYSVTYNGLGLKLNGATPKQIQGGPGAVEAGFSNTYTMAMNTSNELIKSPALWSALGGGANAGSGIKVGVIDSGIDQMHPFLQPNDGMTYPEGFPKGDTRFTSEKVIVAKVYNQDPFLTPQAFGSHGTHVSGTIAGKAGTVAPGAATPLSGVAPGAWLGNYNVFPGQVESASSVFIAKAVEEAVIDGMDVLNLSLGGTPHKGADLLDMAVNAAADAGLVVAIAAGNEGPNFYTVGSPGTASNVITVAAVTNSHWFAGTMTTEAFPDPIPATSGDGDGSVGADGFSGEYDVWSSYANGDVLACTPIAGQPLAGKIALISRGACTFSQKILNAEAAGALGVIVYNNSGANPIYMSTPGVHIPATMISKAHGVALSTYTGSRHVEVSGMMSEYPETPNMLAGFSSWGPTPNYDLKPDVAAIGVGVYSSVVGGGYEPYQGTSMATPHVAGASALLLAYSQQHGLGWGPAEVKAALMGTAGSVADKNDPLKVGAGLIDVSAAMNPGAMAFPSSLSFGLVRPVGNQTYAMTLELRNTSGLEQTYTLSDPNGWLDLPAAVTVAAGESASFTVTVMDRGDHQPAQAGTPDARRGVITASSAGGSIKIPYLYMIDYNQ